MAWIEIIDENKADGLLADLYKTARRRAGRVFNILKLQGLNPSALKASIDQYLALMWGESPLSRGQREMLAVVVSRANNCHY